MDCQHTDSARGDASPLAVFRERIRKSAQFKGAETTYPLLLGAASKGEASNQFEGSAKDTRDLVAEIERLKSQVSYLEDVNSRMSANRKEMSNALTSQRTVLEGELSSLRAAYGAEMAKTEVSLYDDFLQLKH